MDWFKRYGIPGAYFLMLVLAWLYATYQCWLNNLNFDNIVKLVGFLFLPAGYILSISGQLYYLRISNNKGLHSQAAKRTRTKFFGEKKND